MKALKITLALLAITVLTVSGAKSEDVVTENSDVNQPAKIDLLASGKKLKAKLPPRG